MKKTRKWTRLIVLFLALVCVLMVPSEKVYAWKTKTHGYSANILLKDVENGYVTIDGTRYTIPDEYKTALLAYPEAFRAGVLGPDFYPDMLTGQSYIHPYDAKAGVGVGDWLMELVNGVNSLPKDSNARNEALAFTLGMAIHFAGDQFGHDFINAFAGGAYPAYAEAAQNKDKLYYIIRHMAEETYMDSLIGSKLGETSVDAPEKFIISTWIYDGTANAGPAAIYSKYSGGMMYQYKYLVEMRQKLYKYAESKRPSIIVPMPQIVQYLDKWIADLDKATYQLLIAFDDIAQDFMTGVKGKSDIQIVTDRLNKWLDDYGKYASPAPDILTDIAKAFAKSQEWVLNEIGLGDLTEQWKQFKTQLISNMVLWGLAQAGIDVNAYADLLKDPKKALEANHGSTADYEEFKTYMDAFAQDPESFAAFYNTLLMGKLILMGPDNLNDFFSTYKAASFFSNTTGEIMMDEIYIEIWTKTNGFLDTYGTDDNVFCDVYEGDKLIRSKLLDTSGHNDFENEHWDRFYVELDKKISPSKLRVALRMEKSGASLTSPNDWTTNEIWITCRCLGNNVLSRQKVLGKDLKFDKWGERKFLSFSTDGISLTYDTALNPKIISYMKSNDNSTQWVNDYNSLWSNLAARKNILFEVFHGFKPTITLSASETSFQAGTKATLKADFTSYWNGITKERRDKEYIVASVGETKQQACSGTVDIMEVSGETPNQILTGTVSNGKMTVDLSSLAPGTYKLRADYDGDDFNGSAKSNVVEVTVTRSYTVKFQVVNGSWDDGSTAEQSVTVSGTSTTLHLEQSQIPAVGSKPLDYTYKAGSWSPSLSTSTDITGNMTFVYTYEKKKAISQTVTFTVVNGSWDDGSTDNKTVVLNGLEGDTLKLSEDQIPAVGSKPLDYTYKPGSWDTTPSTDLTISGNTTFTYTYAKKEAISQTVTFVVVNGSWDDGSTEKKTVVLNGLEGDTLKLSEGQIPAVGTKPLDHSYTEGSWDTVPDTETAITDDPTYTYSYALKEKYTVQFETNGGSPIDDVIVLAGDPVEKPGDPDKHAFAFAGWYEDESLETPYDFSKPVFSGMTLYAAWEPIVYTADGDVKYTHSTIQDAVLTVHRSHADEKCFDHFTGVMIDDQLLEDGTDYTAAAGSTVVTLKGSTLEELSVGEHTVTVLFDDGQADAALVVNNVQYTPDAGDGSAIGAWALLFIASLSGIALMAYDRKRAAAK